MRERERDMLPKDFLGSWYRARIIAPKEHHKEKTGPPVRQHVATTRDKTSAPREKAVGLGESHVDGMVQAPVKIFSEKASSS